MNEITTHFGGKCLPFAKDIKPAKAIVTSPAQECRARLEYVKRHGGIMQLTGDAGCGKTLSLRCFADSLNETLYRVIYTPLTTLSDTDLLRHINDKLGLKSRISKSVLYRQIQQEILDSREQQGKTIVLIIDEAHLLRVPTLRQLRLLTNFKMDSYDPFILILAGQSDLKRVMEYAVLEPLAQRIAIRYQMAPLQPEETADYIRQQMKLAGFTEPIFGDDALAAIHELSFGIPRKIGNMAMAALTYVMFDERKHVSADDVVSVNKAD